MLLNQILFWMMISEAVICLIISLPFGKRVSLTVIQFLTNKLRDTTASWFATVILALISILFLSDVNTCYRHHSSTGATLSDGMRIRLLSAQRDMYISGFCLFLFLLLRLVYSSMETNIHLEKSLFAMKKQAEGASAGYKQQVDENESIKKQLQKVHSLLGMSDDNDDGKDTKKKTDVLAKLIEENATLTTTLEATTRDLEFAENKVEVVKKQAESQSAAFMKLMDEKNEMDKYEQLAKDQEKTIEQQQSALKELKKECESLKTQIQDYDFMFAEAKKKAE